MSSSLSSPAMTLADEQPSARDTIHPDYAFKNGDLVLLSSDGTQFRVHLLILQLVSSAFTHAIKNMEGDGPIVLDESSVTLSTLLDMVYPMRRPPTTMSISHFRAVAIAAEKYGMANVTSTLKDLILDKHPTTTLISDNDDHEQAKKNRAIAKYLMAFDLGWTSVVNDLSTETLSCDLDSEFAQDLLYSGDRTAARNLSSLHRRRRIWIYNAVVRLVHDNADRVGGNEEQTVCSSFLRRISPNPTLLRIDHAPKCVQTPMIYQWSNSHCWWRFKARVLRMLETNTSGSQFLADKFYTSDVVEALLYSPCCKNKLFTNLRVLRNYFSFIVERIPKSVEGFREVKLEKNLPKSVAPRSDEDLDLDAYL